jgi:hypothetical protein
MERVVLSAIYTALIITVNASADMEVVHSDYGTVNVAGYCIGRYDHRWGATEPGSFSVRAITAMVYGDIFEYARYYFLADFSKPDVLVDGYGALKVIPYTEIKFGQFLVPFGLETNQSTSKILCIDRSLISTRVAPARPTRDIGAMVEISYCPQDSPFYFRLGTAVINGTGINKRDDNKYKDLAARVSANPLPFGFFGCLTTEGYFYYGKVNIERDDPNVGGRILYGGAIALDKPWFSVQGEYMKGSTDTEPVPGFPYTLDTNGFYLQGSYKQRTPLPWLHTVEPLVRYEIYNPDQHAPNDRQAVVTGGVNVHFAEPHHCKLMVNYSWWNEEGNELNNDLIAAQFSVRF